MRTTMLSGLAAGVLCALLLQHDPTLRRTLDYTAGVIVAVVAGITFWSSLVRRPNSGS